MIEETYFISNFNFVVVIQLFEINFFDIIESRYGDYLGVILNTYIHPPLKECKNSDIDTSPPKNIIIYMALCYIISHPVSIR